MLAECGSSVKITTRGKCGYIGASQLAVGDAVGMDSLDDLPPDSRSEVLAEVCALLDVTTATAEDLVRAAEPLWDAMERAGGLVDSWGGGEFCHLFPKTLAFIRTTANPR